MKKILLGCLIASMPFLTSCEKEGCTDPDSVHYDDKADSDDGSCEYEGSQVFWYGETTAQALVNQNVTLLKFYLNGNLSGSTAADVYRVTTPTCSDNLGALKITMDLGGVKTQSYTLTVETQDGIEVWDATVNFNANTCTSTELTY